MGVRSPASLCQTLLSQPLWAPAGYFIPHLSLRVVRRMQDARVESEWSSEKVVLWKDTQWMSEPGWGGGPSTCCTTASSLTPVTAPCSFQSESLCASNSLGAQRIFRAVKPLGYYIGGSWSPETCPNPQNVATEAERGMEYGLWVTALSQSRPSNYQMSHSISGC